MRVTRDELHVLAGATRRPRELARLFARAVLSGHELDVHLRREARVYSVNVMVVAAEVIVSESEFTIDFDRIEEVLRLGVLALLCKQLVLGGERSVRQADVALRAARARWATTA